MFNHPSERGQLRRDQNQNLDPNLPASQMPMTYGQSAASGPAPTTAGHHKHDFLNKIDPAVDSTRDNQPVQQHHHSNVPEGTYGPHRSRIANALDPRVDSDLDSSRNRGMGNHMSGGPGAAAPVMHGASGPMGSYNGSHVPEGTYGPHSSRMGNALDPRVDSDADRHRAAGHGYAGNNVPEGTYGPHSTRMGNAVDPRVDSDADRYRSGGMTGTGRGPNAAVMGRQHQHGGVNTTNAHLPGPAPNTAGPHKSDLLNKLDPRVDSKGGMTYGESDRRGL